MPASPADAVNLAGDLETLMDAFTTEGIDWHALELAVEADYSEYFEITRDFVQIAGENWPQILAERQASDPAQRRSALIEAEAERLTRERPQTPIIVAGSTGSMPATANLIAAIARLPNGAVVLPGLDTDLDEESWATIGGVGDDETDPVHGHPQAIAAPPARRASAQSRASDVTVLGRRRRKRARPATACSRRRCARPTPPTSGRDDRSRATRRLEPAAAARALPSSRRWTSARRRSPSRSRCARRSTQPGTGRPRSSRPTARSPTRVAAELARWGVARRGFGRHCRSPTRRPDASRGLPAEAAARRLAARARCSRCSRIRCVRLGLPRETVEHAASVLEIGVLRGPAPAPGLDGHARGAGRCRRAENDRRTPRPRRRLTRGRLGPRRRSAASASASPSTTFTPAVARRGQARSRWRWRSIIAGRSKRSGPVPTMRRTSRTTMPRRKRWRRSSTISSIRNPRGGRPAARGPLRRLSGLLHGARQAAHLRARRRARRIAASRSWAFSKRACSPSTGSCSAGSTRAPGRRAR